MKYRIIHGDKHWEAVAGPFPMTRRRAMANAEAYEAQISAAVGSTLEAAASSKAHLSERASSRGHRR